MRLFHGTDTASAAALAGGAPLDVQAAQARHTNGAVGFYLATHAGDAEFFAVRLGPGRVLAYEFTREAIERLERRGGGFRPIPQGPASPHFGGDEFFVPPDAFPTFNELLSKGGIRVERS